MLNELDHDGGLKDANPSFQVFKAQLHAWRHNRTLYPGWVLAPYQTRERIWNSTKHWLNVAIAANAVWSEPQLLVMWRELTWRLGISLQIVPDEALDTISNIVDRSEDLIHGVVDVEGFFPTSEGWPSDFDPSSEELRECWLACKLALLQGYRFRPDIAAFDQVESKLYALRDLTIDQHSFVLHQSCLRAMAELDTDRTQSLLARWPSQPEDDYWLVRKAAVLLELGDLRAARLVADDALPRIRGRQQTKHTDYWKLSREGWCLRLLTHLEWLQKYSSVSTPVDVFPNSRDTEEWTNPAWKSRLDHRLEAARCSPDAELRALQGRITKRFPPARPSQRGTNPPSFDTGHISESVRWTMDIPSDRLAPAINLLLVSDMTGYSLAGDFGMYATSWIRDEFPGLWAAFALRCGGIGVTRDPDPSGQTKPDSIRRTTLEQLPLQHVERLFSATFKELERHVERVETGQHSQKLAVGGGVLTSASGLSDIVTRLSMCLNDDAREKLVEVLVRAARIPLFRRHPAEQETIRHLVDRSIRYLGKEQLRRWFFRILLGIPLDSSDESQLRGLPSIGDSLLLSKIDKIEREESREVDSGIRVLIDEVGSSDIKARTDAALRLLLLVDLKILSRKEVEAFAKALWKTVDECNLPVIDDKTITKYIHVLWPEETEGQGVEGIRKWIFSGGVENRFGRAQEDREEVQEKMNLVWPDPGVYLPMMLDLAQRLEDNPEKFEQIFNYQSRDHILESIFSWWAREKELFDREAQSSFMPLGDVFARVDLSLRVIFECVLSRETLNARVLERLSSFLNDIERFGRSSAYMYPILACMDRESQKEAWNGIRNGLWNSDKKISYKALVAAWRWQRGVKRLKLEPIPGSVFGIIVSSIAGLDGVVGFHGVWVLRQLIEKDCIVMEDDVGHDIIAAVDSAAEKLVYGGDHERMSVSDEELLAHFRRHLAELIVCLTGRGVKLGPVGTRWIKQAREDCFVDVRRIANEWRE